MSATHGVSSRTGDPKPRGEAGPPGKFGRLFPNLEPLQLEPKALVELGNAMVEPAGEPDAREHPNLPAGFPYLGQFIDHDITFDPTSLKEAGADPGALRNFRTPALDLDSVYGSGPMVQPYLYQRPRPFLFQPGETRQGIVDRNVPGELPHDLPRALNGFAVIADPRNDENLIVSQLHLAFLLFHNEVVTRLDDGRIPRQFPLRKSVFDEARELVVWHYQWIALHDFLPRIAEPAVLEQVRREGSMVARVCARRDCEPFIPVEFSAAAFRFGHSMVRSEYDYNRLFNKKTGRAATLAQLFEFSGRRGGGGSVPIPSDWIIDWRRFFEVGSGVSPGRSRRIVPYLSNELGRLSLGAGQEPINLAARNLLRGNSMGLPSAQCIARLLGYPVLKPERIADSGPDGKIAARHGLHIETPLWYYILKEAQLKKKGLRLGRLGSRIVAETIVGLMESDSHSFLVRDPRWTPVLPGKKPETFTMADLLEFVGKLNPIGEPLAVGSSGQPASLPGHDGVIHREAGA